MTQKDKSLSLEYCIIQHDISKLAYKTNEKRMLLHVGYGK